MPFLQSTVATVERHSRPLGLLILNDQNHVSRRPGTKSTSLLADKNYLHFCRPPRPARRKYVEEDRESWRSKYDMIDQLRSQKSKRQRNLFNAWQTRTGGDSNSY